MLFSYKIEKACFSSKKEHFCCSFFCVSLCFFLAFLGPPPFSLSLFFVSLSLSLCSFLSSFLSVSHFCIWFLVFFFYVLFVFSFKLFFCSSVFLLFSACCLNSFVLNHNLRFVFALHLVFSLLLFFFVFVAFIFCYFFDFWKPIKNISENMEIPKTAKMKNAEKKKRTF